MNRLVIDELLFIVGYHPVNTKLRSNLTNNAVVVNERFNITCSSEANPPAKYRFYKNQNNLVNDTTGSDVSVITTSVSERREQVNYSCTPFNEFGDGPTDGLTLTVLCKYVISIAMPSFMFYQNTICQLRKIIYQNKKIRR